MLMSLRARIRQIDRLVSGCSVQCQGPQRHLPGAAAAHPRRLPMYARYPLWWGPRDFDLEQLIHGTVPWHCARVNIRAGLSMTEQVPEDLTEAEVADRREADRSEDEGDTASEVDRWEDEGGHDRVG
jgi:hypothetical protein